MQHNGKKVEIIFMAFPEDAQCVPGLLMESRACYKILIDSTRPPQTQRHTLGHELAHLYLDHLDQHDRNIWEQEREANQYAWKFYREYKAGRLSGSCPNPCPLPETMHGS